MAKKEKPNPFELLLDDMTRTQNQPQPASSLNFSKLLKSNDNRKEKRNVITGYINIYNEAGALFARAVLRDISIGGVGVETHNIEIAIGTKFVIEISGKGAALGKINCRVTRVSPIAGHERQHKSIGFEFENNPADFKAKISMFTRALSIKIAP